MRLWGHSSAGQRRRVESAQMGSLHELGTSLLVVALVVAVVWAVRRFTPPLRCPHCGSIQFIFLMDTKECARCGRWFD
jgi:hypothetical protein